MTVPIQSLRDRRCRKSDKIHSSFESMQQERKQRLALVVNIKSIVSDIASNLSNLLVRRVKVGRYELIFIR